MAQVNLSTEKKSWTWRIDLWLQGGGGGSGMDWVLGVNYCFWNGLAMRSCCIALKTMSSHLLMGEKRMYTCMCNWVTKLYSREKNVLGKLKKKERKLSKI